MLSSNWFKFVFREIHFLKSFFWPHDISYAGRELLKLSKEAKHLLGSVFKNRALLCLNIFRCDVTTGEVWKILMTQLGSEKKIKWQF